jgi:pyruvate/2-oxoglutarate dehydrogenase complex dihydrolipoamide acyltransferase (E2) component
MQGGVLTLTCHGEDGPVFATPALNSPQSAALALFPIREQARMNLALAHDARLISAATAAAFIACFKAALSEPLHLLIGT